MVKYICILGLLLLTGCHSTQSKEARPTLTEYTIHLKNPITIWFMNEDNSLKHSKKTSSLTNKISILFDSKYVSSKLEYEWFNEGVIVRSNSHEYVVLFSSIAYFSKSQQKLKFDKEKKKWVKVE